LSLGSGIIVILELVIESSNEQSTMLVVSGFLLGDVSTAELIEEILAGDVISSPSSEPVVNNNQDIPPVPSADPTSHNRNEASTSLSLSLSLSLSGTCIF
jgi:hypothetical protein